MNEQELRDYIKKNLSNWTIYNQKLHLEVKTQNWTQSMSIANMISYFAERFNHHPDLQIKYSSVQIDLFTHSSNSISEKDLNLAKNITNLLNSNK